MINFTSIFLLAVWQIINLFWAIRISRNVVSFAFLANVILTLNLIGSIVLAKLVYYENLRSSLYLLFLSSMINIGVFLANYIFRRYPNEQIVGLEKRNLLWSRTYLISIRIYFFIAVLVTVLFFTTTGIPVLSEDLELTRKAFTLTEGANFYYRVTDIAMPMLAAAAITLCFGRVPYGKYRRNVVILLIITATTLLLLGFKGKVLWFMVLSMMTVSLYIEGKLLRKWVIILSALGVISGIVVTQLIYEAGPIRALVKLIQRSTIDAAGGFNILVYEYLPRVGRSDVEGRLQNYLFEWKFPGSARTELGAFGLTVTLAGSLIYYFGIAGLVLGIIFGFVGRLFELIAYRKRRNPILAAGCIYITYSMLGLLNRGVSSNYLEWTLSSAVFFILTLGFMFWIFRYSQTRVYKKHG